MKVILIKDVARLGRKSEIKDVPSGHAINFLIPRKLAIIATEDSLKRVNEEHKKQAEQKEHNKESFEQAVSILKEKVIVYSASANEQGHLFKGIHVDDIASRLAEDQIAITKQHIILEHPIKELGLHEVELSFGGVKGVCHLEVVKK